jgi:uncharacterized protein YbaP (TraB family)
MIAVAVRLGAALLAALIVAPAVAEPPPVCHGRDLGAVAGVAKAREKRASDLLNADGLLWRIDKGSLPPSYLFGTIHSTDEGALAVARRAAEHIPGAKVVVTELGGPMDAAAKAEIGARMLARALDHDYDTFADAPPEDLAAIEAEAVRLGYPSAFARHLKLWFLAMLVDMPACEARREALDMPEVDLFLTEAAQAAGVRVAALETADEQIAAIAAMRPEVAATLIAVSARHPDVNDDVYATLLKLYRESRPADILAVSDALDDMSPKERAAEDELTRALLAGRNATMDERLQPLLHDGGAFVAVGALHLTGRDGLVERLRARGFTLTKVW